MFNRSNWWFLAIIILFCLGLIKVPQAEPAFTDQNVIDAIVGEAADQEFPVKMCVAEAIRNRGTLRGVYGYHAEHNKKESPATYADAAEAWVYVKTHPSYNFLNGATEFRSTTDEQPSPDFMLTKQCGDFEFYKPTTTGGTK